MRVILISHDSAVEHDSGPGHPERPERIPAALSGVTESGLEVIRAEAPQATADQLERIHDPGYVRALERLCAAGGGALDADTRAGPRSWEAALRAAGAGDAAVTEIRAGRADAGFVVMRPPGHHALAGRAMGFCLFNNIAIAAAGLVEAGERVAIVDWDVHHGNGTQDVFLDEPSVLYVSWHEYPAYPGTGRIEDIDRGAEGTTVNIPMLAGADGAPYSWSMSNVVVPALQDFGPDWILVSAGYDAHVADPLASIRLVADDYRSLAAALTRAVPSAPTVLFLEGGYDLDALRTSISATLAGLADSAEVHEPQPGSGPVWEVMAAVASAAARHWNVEVPRFPH